ncbi:MAG: hypothetical protein AUJ52_01880 [Elusimicrobia bacterium CG1_02_63_36]|nr:MAG: hypothetical protein AUJ52_01880 [Elusimicrobia bacterium CG1_02_63_36]PIP82459.1 MAG: hypothetical protein COR54_14685 [Elusimicrobia bacterium CG22_combo_CG10-13_8_21_14_all_63_91]PJA16351.1 MAG: hypothetical protein COX66_07745 [Elusimicrobia bacterium CG_4_10_14_0_2_um_filter_63_34]PJB26888.1 MAG: hypothetical protein CO113_01200 [Elusimicrobia bacterium CG_4_9_14_3_um_filter_62_55]
MAAMNHEAIRDRISLEADGLLPDAEKDALSGHLRACPECAAFSASVRASAALFRAQRPPARSEDFVQRVLDRLPPEEPPALPLHWLVPAFCAAFALTIVVWTPMISSALASDAELVADASPLAAIWEDAP